jgi:hypothetical protein
MNPLPPKICVASRALSIAASPAVSLASAAAVAKGVRHHAGARRAATPGATMHALLHPRQQELDRLARTQRFGEHDATAGVVQRRLQTALRRTGGEGGDGDAPLVEDAEEVREAPAALAEQVLRRNAGARAQRMGVGRVPAPCRTPGPVKPGCRRAR